MYAVVHRSDSYEAILYANLFKKNNLHIDARSIFSEHFFFRYIGMLQKSFRIDVLNVMLWVNLGVNLP